MTFARVSKRVYQEATDCYEQSEIIQKNRSNEMVAQKIKKGLRIVKKKSDITTDSLYRGSGWGEL